MDELEVVFFLCIRIGLAYCVGLLGKKRQIGFGWAFALSFFWLMVGLIFVLCSKKKDVNFVNIEKEGK